MPELMATSLFRPLNVASQEIRILHLRSPETLSFNFEYTELSSQSIKDYHAISWRWGDPTLQSQLTVDGKLLLIPQNALEVILDLCVAQRVYRIWIDAVCINQQDLEERSQQVAMMSVIYQHAIATLAWLGPDSSKAREGVDALQEILDLCRYPPLVEGDAEVLSRDERNRLFFPEDVDWHGVAAFFEPQWFQRFWVIQEVAFSKAVYLYRGSERVDWRALVEVAHYMTEHKIHSLLTNQAGMQGLRNASIIGKVADGGWVLNLLNDNQDFLATDPRDRMFAMYGLLGRDLAVSNDASTRLMRQACRPDYSKSVFQVFAEATKAALRCDLNRSSLLYDCGRLVPRLCDGQRSYGAFPSWIPRYDFVQDFSRGSYMNAANKDGDTTLISGKPVIDFDTDLLTLRITGRVLDRVRQVIGQTRPEPETSLQASPLLVQLVGFWHLLQQSNSATPGTHLSDILMLASTAGHLNATWDETKTQYCAFVERMWPGLKPAYKLADLDSGVDAEHDDEATADDADSDGALSALANNGIDSASSHDSEASSSNACNSSDSGAEDLQQSERAPRIHRVSTMHRDEERAQQFWRHVSKHLTNRTLMLSQRGQAGSGASDAQVGDIIVDLEGLPILVLLRPEGNKYKLVGDAYLPLHSTACHASAEEWFNLV